MSQLRANLLPPSVDATAIGQGLAAPRNAIETAFLHVGDLLARSGALLDTISATFDALPRDLERPQVDHAADQLGQVGLQAEQISGAFARERQEVTQLVAVVANASWPIADLRRSIRMMGIVAVNARVVAATVTTLSDAEVFTADISALASSATETIAEFSAIYDRLRQDVQTAATARDRFETAQSGSLDQLASRIAAGLDGVARHRQQAAAGGTQTAALSREIAKRVMAAVMALQVGDATRQRVEHVEAMLSSAAGSPDHALAVVAALAAEQLHDTIKTLDIDVDTAEQSLAALARDAAAITARSRDLYGTVGDGESALGVLNQQMRLGIAVLQQCERERREISAIAGAIEQTVGALLSQVAAVQDIGANMKLVSLNAAIRCAHLGPTGAALNVIATQLRDLTSETVRAAEASAILLHEAATLALAFGAVSGDVATQRMLQLEQDAAQGLKAMEDVETGIHAALLVLQSAGAQVADLLAHASDGFSNHQSISEALSDIHMQIAATSGARLTNAAPNPDLNTLLAAIRKTYTIQVERQIHDGMFAPQPAALVIVQGQSTHVDTLKDTEGQEAPASDLESGADDILFF